MLPPTTLACALSANRPKPPVGNVQSVAQCSVSRSEASFESGDPAQLAAQARRGAARSEAAATALRVVSPLNGLVEFRPAKIQTESGRPGAEQTVSSSELLWVVSLIVPFRPKVLGAVAVESARARLSDG